MDISKSIQDVTYVISHDDYLNSVYTNTWILFRNYFIRYNILLNDAKSYNNTTILIDFFKKSFNMCKNMKNIINMFTLTTKEQNDFTYKEINKIIDHFINIIYCDVQTL